MQETGIWTVLTTGTNYEIKSAAELVGLSDVGAGLRREKLQTVRESMGPVSQPSGCSTSCDSSEPSIPMARVALGRNPVGDVCGNRL